MQFELTEEQSAKISVWLENTDYHDTYHGAIGGALTFSFTPTSLGVIEKVKYRDKVLDLTEYDLW